VQTAGPDILGAAIHLKGDFCDPVDGFVSELLVELFGCQLGGVLANLRRIRLG
jgi:hypothetical protein